MPKDETKVTISSGGETVETTSEGIKRAAYFADNAGLMNAEIITQVRSLLGNKGVDIYKSVRKNDGELSLSISVKIVETMQELGVITRLSYSKENVKVEAKNKIHLNQLSLPE